MYIVRFSETWPPQVVAPVSLENRRDATYETTRDRNDWPRTERSVRENV